MSKNLKKASKYLLRFLPDRTYVKLYYRLRLGKKLNLGKPRTFNEKLQWLKFNDRDPFYTVIVDKHAVRDYIAETLGEQYLIPLLGVWDTFDDIDFNKLPNQFVLKCNHDSGSAVICTDKGNFDVEKARKTIENSLKCQFYFIGREWQYKNIKPKIIAEEFLGDGKCPPADFKIACFNGVPDNVMISYGRESGTPRFYFLDREWKLLKYNGWGIEAPENFTLPKPDNLENMFSIAELLSKPYYYARIDLYNIKGKIYFGEITLCPNSGFDRNLLPEIDLIFGKKLRLPTIDY